MKLLRLKITDPEGFRSLPCGFEHCFRKEWALQEELNGSEGFAPFVSAGPNGSGKSNLLEVLAAIFYHLECIYLENLPDSFRFDEHDNPKGFQGSKATPDGFEIEYLIKPKVALATKGLNGYAHIKISKNVDEPPTWHLLNLDSQDGTSELAIGRTLARELLPEFVLAYSSGENEILSLPFFKMRFIQFDEYWKALTRQEGYDGRPETRLAYLDNGFSQAILLCNLLFQDDATLQPFREDIGIEALNEFRIIIRRSITIQSDQVYAFDTASDSQKKERLNRLRSENREKSESEMEQLNRGEIVKSNSALREESDANGNPHYHVNLLQLLEGDDKSSRAVSALKRCATLSYLDESTDTLILDYYVNDATKQAFRDNFDNKALTLFQAFRVLLTLNLYSVSNTLKADLYQSPSHYVSETVPILASDQRIMRFKFVRFRKRGVAKPTMLKELSDGEHQLLHSLGLCLLFRNTNSLFLLDEPETHFNPDWRANFITRLRSCFPNKGDVSQEMLITTHTPFLISDSKPEKVLVFKRDNRTDDVSVQTPEYNTLGASINKITMSTFGKRETIGGRAQSLLNALRARFDEGVEDKDALIIEIQQQLGDSVEKMLLIKAILDSEQHDSSELHS